MESTGAYSTTPRAAAISEACAYMSLLHKAFAERFAAAHRLLQRGGWTCAGTTLRFPDDTIVEGEACSCQEGRGPVVCLHQLAARMLLIAIRQGAPATPAPAASETATATELHCQDCGAVLDSPGHAAAKVGRRRARVCVVCLRRRIQFGRRRQLASDAQFAARVQGRA